MKSTFSDRCFHDEAAAYDWAEALLWPEGPICPHCGGVDRISKMGGKSTRIGTYKCYQCRKPFTVKVGTVFESSHVPLRHWLQAMFLLASSKKGISANRLSRTLGCTLKTGRFIGHRIREGMKTSGLTLPRWVRAVALSKPMKFSSVASRAGRPHRLRPQDGRHVAGRAWRQSAVIPYRPDWPGTGRKDHQRERLT
jgi:transposase-like protein